MLAPEFWQALGLALIYVVGWCFIGLAVAFIFGAFCKAGRVDEPCRYCGADDCDGLCIEDSGSWEAR